jgi:hypothetical protein
VVALLLYAPAPTISVTHRFRQSPAEISTPSKSSRIGRPSSRPAVPVLHRNTWSAGRHAALLPSRRTRGVGVVDRETVVVLTSSRHFGVDADSRFDHGCGSSGVRHDPRSCGRSGGRGRVLPRVLTDLERGRVQTWRDRAWAAAGIDSLLGRPQRPEATRNPQGYGRFARFRPGRPGPSRRAAPFDHRVLADEMSCKHFCALSVVLAEQIACSTQRLSWPERGSLVAANPGVAQSWSG